MKEYIFRNQDDINLRDIFECGQCFRWNAEDPGGGCADSYVGVAGGNACRAELISENDGTASLRLETSGGSEEFWRDYFDLDSDYGEYKRELMEKEPELADVIASGGGIRILHQDMFETLISFIVSQNNNIPRIKKCIETICESFGEYIGEYFGRERYAFPGAEVLAGLDPKELMELRLGYRADYIVRSAKRYLESASELFACCSTEERYEELLAYHGIGKKVADCIMLFGMRDQEAFPIDVWVRRIMSERYGFDEDDTRGMQQFAAERFGRLSGLAQQYLFHYYRNIAGEK